MIRLRYQPKPKGRAATEVSGASPKITMNLWTYKYSLIRFAPIRKGMIRPWYGLVPVEEKRRADDLVLQIARESQGLIP